MTGGLSPPQCKPALSFAYHTTQVQLYMQRFLYSNDLQCPFFIVMRALRSGIVFALFFASSIFFHHCRHWSLIHMRCALVKSILLMDFCCDQYQTNFMPSRIGLELGFTSIFLSVSTDSFDHHLMSAYHPSHIPQKTPIDIYYG